MKKITIARALVEKKMLIKQIEKTLLISKFVGVKGKHSDNVNGMPKDDFNKQIKSNYDKLMSLYKNINDISSKITVANATNELTINGEIMTISHAINLKNTLNMKKSILSKISNQYENAIREVDRYNDDVDDEAKELYSNVICSSSSNPNASNKKSQEMEKLVHEFKENHEIELVDPIKCVDVIKKMKDEIEEFEKEVNIALVEANATIEIEIED